MHGNRPQPTSTGVESDRPWGVLVLLAVAQFMVILDITVVNIALPSIGTDLGFAAGDLQWVVTAYVLFTGGLMLLGGRAADLFGRRRIFLSGLMIFTLGSLGSGLAASPGMLIASRAVQGLGAAMLSPAALSIVTATYTGSQRARALGIWGAIGGGGAAAGVLLGGILTSWAGWESVFFINLPIGVIAGGAALHLLPADSGSGGFRRLDLPGAAALVSGLVTLVYAIEGTGTHGWDSARTLVLFAAAGILLASFIAIERLAGQPLVPLATWRARTLSSGMALMLGVTGLFIGVIFLSSLYLQNTLGASAIETGLAFLPMTVTIALAAHASSHLLAQLGTRLVAISGLLLIAAGAALLSSAPADASYAADLLPGFLVIAVGVGLEFPTIQVSAMSEVRVEMAGLASGMMTTAHEIGSAFGVAVLSAVAAGAGALGSAVGYGDGLTLVALGSLALAGLAAATVPTFRPAGAAVSIH
jgi:EmrB/QacA subfamily drug resistance transporter